MAELGDAGKRALHKERMARRKAERVVARVHEQSKAQVAAAEERASRAELQLARLNAALAAGLHHSLADRLEGETAEELAEDARRFVNAR